jgi:pimeloyl-ACP methyl ester carboxylesterase
MPAATAVISELHHEVRGAGPPVLFITGASGDAGHFARAAERLSDEFTTVAYDRRGCSRSAPLPEGDVMSIRGQADDAAGLIEQLGLAPAIAFGTSGGGDILLELIARRPDLLRGAVVHEPAILTFAPVPGPDDDPLRPIVELADDDPRAAMEAFVRMHTDDTTFEALDPMLRERILRNGVRFFAQQLPAFRGYEPDIDRIRAAGTPMRLLVSREGVAFLIGATERLGGDLGIEVESISGHHAPYLGDPDTFAEELRAILRELA